MRWRYTSLVLVGVVLLGVGIAVGVGSAASEQRGRGVASLGQRLPSGSHWVAAWTASPQPATSDVVLAGGFREQTLRDVIAASIGGTAVRVRFTNRFGTRPLLIARAAIAPGGRGSRVKPGSVMLSFGGRPSVVIAPGRDVLSSPARLKVTPMERLSVSMFLPRFTGRPSDHVIAQQINYVAAGDHVLDHGAAFRRRTDSWYFLDGVDVASTRRVLGVAVALGDSITDGVGSDIGANARWPNDLARRLDAPPGPRLSVVDEGIAGNRVLTSSAHYGPSALARFRSDVEAVAGVRVVILLEGLNDIGFSHSTEALTAPHTHVSADQIISGYERLIALAHADGLKIFAGTLPPFRGAKLWTPAGEAVRDAVNRWIRTSRAFDGVIDFARVLAAPDDPEALNPAYDSGDHLHPNDAGYRAMADAVSLSRLFGGA